MIKKALLPIVLILSACSNIPTLYYKDGRQASVIYCEGNSWLGCMKQSSILCQQAGYDIIERNSYRESGLLSNSDKKEMLIICKSTSEPTEKDINKLPNNTEKSPNTNLEETK